MEIFPQQRPDRSHQSHRPDRAEGQEDQDELGDEIDPPPDDRALADRAVINHIIDDRDEDQGKRGRVLRRHQGQEIPVRR